MEISRRGLLAGAAATVVCGLAGCLEGSEEALSSEPATVADAALAESRYEERSVEERPIERRVGRFGVERTVRVRNWRAEYDRRATTGLFGLSQARAAVVAVLTTPRVSALGRSFNPVGDHSTDDLAALIQRRDDRIDDATRVDDGSLTVLGSETTVARYDATAALADAGVTTDVLLHVTEPVPHSEDFVVCVAAYPRTTGFESEWASVRRLLEHLEHG